jgi:peptidoglycan hydrolase CwlO-like protein
MEEPIKPPSREEVKASGTEDWVQGALDKHAKQQQKLANVFGETKKELRKQKDALADLFSAGADEEDQADRGPDLFAQERSKVEQQKKKLASVWDQDQAERQAEQDQLRNLFGSPQSKPKKRP